MHASREGLGLKKRESVMLQGMAILLMLYHHFFNDPSIYGESLSFWNQTVVLKFAWFGKICVGIFAFVSGYGTCKVFERNQKGDFFERLARNYLICLRQMGSLLIRYWLVLTGFMGLLFLLGKKEFDSVEFARNFALIEYSYNGAHWYVGQYLKMLALLPLLDGLFMKAEEKDFRKRQVIFYAALFGIGIVFTGILFWNEEFRRLAAVFAKWMRIAFLLVFFVGWFLAKFSLYDRIFEKVEGWKKEIRFALGMLLCIVVMAVRMSLSDSPAYATLDFLFVPFFILGILLVTRACKPIHSLFVPFGTISAYVWLTHLFCFDLTKDVVMNVTRSHLAFYAVQLLFSVIAGSACKGLEILIKKFISKKPQA